MNPKPLVTQWLDSIKDKISPGVFRTQEISLKRYLEYLRLHQISILKVDSSLIDQYRTHLYLERAHHRKTIWLYTDSLRQFYDYLISEGIVKQSPIGRYRAKRSVLKDRYYTNEEILKSYIANWRRIYSSSTRIVMIKRAWKRITHILGKLKLRLQALKRDDLSRILCLIDSYPNHWGTRLSIGERQETLAILKGILKWMHRNAYTKEDLSWNLGYRWTIEPKITHLSHADIDQVWLEYEKKYLEEMQVRLRQSTCALIHRTLRPFWRYLTKRGIKDIHSITKEILEGYRALIFERKRLADSTRASFLGAARNFMGWLERTDQILINPCHRILWPQAPKGLPTKLMSEHDVKALLKGADIATPYGLRARAIFELMYSTGARAGEACGIRFEDIDFENGLLKIQEPKGGPDYQRVIPIGQTALFWIKKYLKEARDQFNPDRGYERHVFLTAKGKPLTARLVTNTMQYLGLKLGMRKLYSSHSWRVTCATGMLKNRADIRHVQEQLGHRRLDSTQRYTRLVPMDLKRVHTKTHPREREYRRHPEPEKK